MKKNLLLLAFLLVFSNRVKSQLINTIIGNHASGYSGDGGPALSAQLKNPRGMATDATGNIYIADGDNYVVRKVSPTGIISLFAGTPGTSNYGGDGGPATSAQLRYPNDVAVDAVGNVYIADLADHCIRMVNPSGIISTFAGDGLANYFGDGGQAFYAELNGPSSVEVDAAGNVYISDSWNHVIRKVNTSGIISTIVGTGFGSGTSTGGYSGDNGSAILAKLNWPQGIAIDNIGNLYIVDKSNNRIRVVNTAGIISTFAGTGVSGYNGDGGPAVSAQYYDCYFVTADASGNVYFSDDIKNVIRMVNTSGIISTFAGTSTTFGGYSGDGGPAILAEFDSPGGVTIDASGNLLIADENNQVIRKAGNCIAPVPSICMVQVDSLSQNNIIFWDKTPYTSADTFYIYRDTSNYNYAPIGKIAASSLSMFVDTARTIYAANGDPNVTSWRYKISYYDTCANSMSPMSPWHQTIYQYNIGGLFIWNHYQIEGQPTPVPGLLNYLLRRDNLGATGNYITAATAAAASTNINDPQYTTYQSTADWKVETVWNIGCTPTLRTIGNSTESAIVKSRSNIKTNRGIGINKFQTQNIIKVYPNPATNEISILMSKDCNNCSLEITNSLGQVLIAEKLTLLDNKINIASLANGVYYVKVKSENNANYVQKIVVQH